MAREHHFSFQLKEVFAHINDPSAIDRWAWAILQLSNDVYLARYEFNARKNQNTLIAQAESDYFLRLAIAFTQEGCKLLFHPPKSCATRVEGFLEALTLNDAEVSAALDRLDSERETGLLSYNPKKSKGPPIGFLIRNLTFHSGIYENNFEPVWKAIEDSEDVIAEMVYIPDEKRIRATFLDGLFYTEFITPKDQLIDLVNDMITVTSEIGTQFILQSGADLDSHFVFRNRWDEWKWRCTSNWLARLVKNPQAKDHGN